MDRGKRILNLTLSSKIAEDSVILLHPSPIAADISASSTTTGNVYNEYGKEIVSEIESSENGDYSDSGSEYIASEASTPLSESSFKINKKKTYRVLTNLSVETLHESSGSTPGLFKETNYMSGTENELTLIELAEKSTLLSANETDSDSGHKLISEQRNDLNTETPTDPLPEQTTKSRKRGKFANPNNWQKNKRKEKVTRGETHISKSGKIIPDKLVLPIDCTKCRTKCSNTFTDEDRLKLNRQYWNLGNADMKRAYLNALITEMDKACTRTSNEKSRRTKTRHFFLPKGEGKNKIRVCQKFFLATFHVSNSVIDSVLHKRNEQYVRETDKRGRHEPANKRTSAAMETIVSHIAKFPRVPSHYTRKDTQKEYLPSDLNLRKMYDMYCEDCKESNIQPEKIWFYRHLFHKKFNLSFHHPKKDVCDKCYLFSKMSEDEINEKRIEHSKHIERKILARSTKDEFKQRASNNEIIFFQFDLEAVRYCPQVKAKAIFYKRRLAVYNLTCYNVASKKAINYMWHEGMAGRGSSEVASCLYMNLAKHQDGKEVALMSDTCGGQNRNSIVTAMFMLSVQVLNIPKIDHIFFEPGHSQMECDSVHAQIEKAAKDMEIFDPSGWFAVVRMASRNKHYEVIEVNQSEVLDFKKLSSDTIKNIKIDLNGENVRWLDIVWMQFRKDDPFHVYFKYEYKEDFRKLKIQRRPIRRFSWAAMEIEKKYNEPLQIQKEKYLDLIELLSSGIIPQNYSAFYESLNVGNDERSEEEEGEDDN